MLAGDEGSRTSSRHRAAWMAETTSFDHIYNQHIPLRCVVAIAKASKLASGGSTTLSVPTASKSVELSPT